MLPERPRIARCPRCRALFWLENSKLGWAGALAVLALAAFFGWQSFGGWGLAGGLLAGAWVAPLVSQVALRVPLRFAEPLLGVGPADYSEALSRQMGDTPERELWLRLRLHWAANDVITGGRTAPGDPDKWSSEARANAERLVALATDAVTKAEFLRELGRFDEVRLEGRGWMADAVRSLLGARSRAVVEISPPSPGREQQG
ncbi:MAG: hypothetical protein QM765_34935 [Myxococcales bacterium]